MGYQIKIKTVWDNIMKHILCGNYPPFLCHMVVIFGKEIVEMVNFQALTERFFHHFPNENKIQATNLYLTNCYQEKKNNFCG